MKYVLTAVKDELVGFMEVQTDVSVEVAKRKFAYAVNKKDSLIEENKAHFSLYKLGEYDTETGEIKAFKELIIDATSLGEK